MLKTSQATHVRAVLDRLYARYGGVTCELDHRNAYELTAATILSAQCTDKRVNMVTPALFNEYPDPAALAAAQQEDVEELVRSTGFYRNKAKNLIGMARGLVERFGGEVPRTMEELLTLPGVARKTANVVLGTAYGIATGVVVDTHVMRVATLLGLARAKDPVRMERALCEVLPRESWIDFSHMIIHHGRQICIARRPQCGVCPLADVCPSANQATKAGQSKSRSTRSSSTGQ